MRCFLFFVYIYFTAVQRLDYREQPIGYDLRRHDLRKFNNSTANSFSVWNIYMGGHYAIEKRKTPQLVFTGIDDIVVLADYNNYRIIDKS